MLPEEIEHTTYGSDSDYKKDVERHIGRMLRIQDWQVGETQVLFKDPRSTLTGDTSKRPPVYICSRRCGVDEH